MTNYIDAHIHLEQYSNEQCARLIENARAANVTHIVAVSMNLESSQATYELFLRAPQLIVPAYGFHPEQPLLSEVEEAKLIDWIKQRAASGEVFAIGEVGLPYYTGLEAKEKGEVLDTKPYISLLERFIILAKELDRPIVLHAVYEDADVTCDLLEKHGVQKAHFHWFKGSQQSIDRMIEAGYSISITPDVYTEQEIQQLVAYYPLELMMVETDGPWPFEGEFAGRMTESAMVVDVVAKIATLKNLPLEQVAKQLYSNSLAFYVD